MVQQWSFVKSSPPDWFLETSEPYMYNTWSCLCSIACTCTRVCGMLPLATRCTSGVATSGDSGDVLLLLYRGIEALLYIMCNGQQQWKFVWKYDSVAVIEEEWYPEAVLVGWWRVCASRRWLVLRQLCDANTKWPHCVTPSTMCTLLYVYFLNIAHSKGIQYSEEWSVYPQGRKAKRNYIKDNV